MANKGQPNEYEKIKLLRVQDNKRRLHELGIKNITNSLASLVESKKTKKKKVKPIQSNARDVCYTPEMGEDSGEDYVEVATSVEVAKKPHRSQYIAPMAMNKVVNLGKNRCVIASNFSDPGRVKHNHSKSILTMGEVISSNRGARQKEVLKQNFAMASSIQGESKKHFTLVDVDDDIFQDMEPTSLEEDVNEGYIVRTQGYTDQDDEYEDMDLFAATNNDDEIERDDMEDEDDELVEDLLHHPQLERAIETKVNKRGPTMMHNVHTRKADEREAIICNEFGQPVGPKDVVGKFSQFLGTIARNNEYAPLFHTSWKKVPHKNKILEYVLGKYDVPDAAKTWVLKTIGNAYKVHKCRFKKKHFYKHKDNKTRWKNRPKNIPEDDFSQLLRLWSSKDVAERCMRAREVRMSQKNMHTAGPKSFARIRDEMRNDNPNKELPSLSQIFERTRKRTDRRAYLDTYDDTAKKIEQMKNYKPPEDGSALVDPFTIVMNKEHDGYLRINGKGVTKKMVKKVDGGEEPYMIPGGLMESFKATIEVEKTQLLEMKKEIEEDHQKKKDELQAMKKDFYRQRANLEATLQHLVKNLPNGVLQNVTDE